MSENVRKLAGVVVMAVLVVVGVAVSSGDDTDFTRNRSFSSRPSTSASADKAADCCDETLALLGSMQTQLTQISSQLQTHLSEESEASTTTSGASPDVQEIADQMAANCPVLGDALASSPFNFINASECVRSYLVGFPLELARQVVLTHGKFGFFERWNFDLGDPNTTSYGWSTLHEVTTEEACEPIFYGYNPPPRSAIAVDTYQGVVLPVKNQFIKKTGETGYFQMETENSLEWGEIEIPKSWYWPNKIEENDLCQ